MGLRRIIGLLTITPRSRPPPHRLLAIYSGALSPAAAARSGLCASVQSAQETVRA